MLAETIIVLAAAIAVFYFKIRDAEMPVTKLLYTYVDILLIIILIAFSIVSFALDHPSIAPGNFTSNTLYQNFDSSLTIYVSSNSGVQAWLGNDTSTNFYKVINSTPESVLGIGVSAFPGNKTETLIVPQDYYYKFNYTTANFIVVDTKG